MKKIFIVILILLSVSIRAQQDEEQLFALTTASNTVGAGMVKIVDPYLSPFEYSGILVRFQSTAQKLFNPEDNTLSYTHKGHIDGGWAQHSNRNNSMMFFNFNYSFGVNHHLRPIDNLMLLLGGSWDLGVGGKYLARNVNNPFSLDLYTGLNATTEVQYLFNLWRQDFRIRYGARVPLFGCMFVPMQGITYYEMFMLKNWHSAIHFSSLHNRQAWSHFVDFDIPLSFSTLRINIQHDYLKYTANEMVFKKSGLNFAVGAVVDLYVFSGKKRKIPARFVSSYE